MTSDNSVLRIFNGLQYSFGSKTKFIGLFKMNPGKLWGRGRPRSAIPAFGGTSVTSFLQHSSAIHLRLSKLEVQPRVSRGSHLSAPPFFSWGVVAPSVSLPSAGSGFKNREITGKPARAVARDGQGMPMLRSSSIPSPAPSY